MTVRLPLGQFTLNISETGKDTAIIAIESAPRLLNCTIFNDLERSLNPDIMVTPIYLLLTTCDCYFAINSGSPSPSKSVTAGHV